MFINCSQNLLSASHNSRKLISSSSSYFANKCYLITLSLYILALFIASFNLFFA